MSLKYIYCVERNINSDAAKLKYEDSIFVVGFKGIIHFYIYLEYISLYNIEFNAFVGTLLA